MNVYSETSATQQKIVGSRSALALYCEEARQEVSGQLTFVGVYNDRVLVPSFPCILPKFAICLFAWTAQDQIFSDVTIRVLLDDEVINETILDSEVLRSAEALIKGGDDLHLLRQSVRFVLPISPLVLQKPCVMRVRIRAEADEIRAGAVEFVQLPQES